MKAQTETVLRNAGEILAAAGMTMADVVSSRVFITDTAMFQDMNAVYRTAFQANPPVRATVKAGLTAPQYLVEITMLAVKGGEPRVPDDSERRRHARQAEPHPEFSVSRSGSGCSWRGCSDRRTRTRAMQPRRPAKRWRDSGER